MSWRLMAIGLGYGGYLLYAYATGALYFYINPVYILPTAVTGAVLVALAVSVGVARGARHGRQTGPDTPASEVDHAHSGTHDTGAHHRGLSWLTLTLLAVPLALGFLLPARPLGISTAAQRGVEAIALGPIDDVPAFRVSSRPETYNIKDWVTAMRSDPDPGSLAGKPVRVSGFVYRERRLPDGWFLVARFVVQCCAVDATPVGLPVRMVGGPAPEDGTWVALEGTWEVAEIDGGRKAVVTPRSIAPIARPDQPYLY